MPCNFTNPFVFPALLVWGTEEQKEKFLSTHVSDSVSFPLEVEGNRHCYVTAGSRAAVSSTSRELFPLLLPA
jgi:hypothetical protein